MKLCTENLFALLSLVDYEVWSDFPEVLKLPILSVLRKAPTYHSLNFSQARLDNLSLILEEAKIEKCSMFDWNNLTSLDDGLNCLAGDGFIKNIFPKDLRSVSARQLLNTSISIGSASIGLTRDVVNSTTQLMVEDKFIEITKRTVAKMYGRGLASYASISISPTIEKFQVPKVDLSLTLEQSLIQAGLYSPDLANPTTLSRPEIADSWQEWPYYHNSVACGLGLTNKLKLDSGWLLFNRPNQNDGNNLPPKGQAMIAGALLGIGLRGYIEIEPFHPIIRFTQERYPLTLISLFLGLCCNEKYAGSYNPTLVSMLTIHLPFLINKNENILQTALITQSAAILSLGFLHRNEPGKSPNKANISRYTDLLLNEINKNADADRDSPNGREAYSTAAGMAVGLLLLGSGNDKSLSPLEIINR